MPLEARGGVVQLASSLPQERTNKKNGIPINRDLTNFIDLYLLSKRLLWQKGWFVIYIKTHFLKWV